ncbi:unnamed protein product, partial [Meganyctiphanes norvegica]
MAHKPVRGDARALHVPHGLKNFITYTDAVISSSGIRSGGSINIPGWPLGPAKYHWTAIGHQYSVLLYGSGQKLNLGSAIAKIIGANTPKFSEFENEVNMWVFEEMVDGKKLTEIINTQHENVKYLPGHTLPSNVISVSLQGIEDGQVLGTVILGQLDKIALVFLGEKAREFRVHVAARTGSRTMLYFEMYLIVLSMENIVHTPLK